LLVLALFLGAAGYGAYRLYDWSQDQYSVGLDDGEVVVYRGLDVPVLRSVEQRTGLFLDDLPDDVQGNVRNGIQVEGLRAAVTKVATLRAACASTVVIKPLPSGPPFLPAWLRTDAPRRAAVAEKCGAS
jgi:hypothetical protein